tara:strand:+ start:491 stop:664 length:174 start_codon:yes stop_codon:yes gene_type:complete
VNDIIEFINDLKEVEGALAVTHPILIQKIAKYQRRLEEFENANDPELEKDFFQSGGE